MKDEDKYFSFLNKSCLTYKISTPTDETVKLMFRLPSFKELSFGALNPSSFLFGDKTSASSVLVPQEFSKLLKVIDDGFVSFYTDVVVDGLSLGDVFKLDIMGCNLEVASVTVLYSLVLGIQEIIFESIVPIACDVPHGFSIDSLVSLIGSGLSSYEDFVFKYGKLSEDLREGINLIGLDGLKGERK